MSYSILGQSDRFVPLFSLFVYNIRIGTSLSLPFSSSLSHSLALAAGRELLVSAYRTPTLGPSRRERERSELQDGSGAEEAPDSRGAVQEAPESSICCGTEEDPAVEEAAEADRTANPHVEAQLYDLSLCCSFASSTLFGFDSQLY